MHSTTSRTTGARHVADFPVCSGRFERSRSRALLSRETFAHLPSLRTPLDDEPASLERLPAPLRRALEGLWLAFQPIVSWSAGRAVGFEALLRTPDSPERCPLSVLLLARELGCAHHLGRLVRERVAASLSSLPAEASVFVNLERDELLDEALLRGDDGLLEQSARVVLELTERRGSGPLTQVRGRVEALRAKGFRVALDDVGAGENGLSAFTELELDVAKLDMHLVHGLLDSHSKRRVVAFLLELCAERGIACVGEGVESEAQRDALLALGCDLLQGHLLGRPRRLEVLA